MLLKLNQEESRKVLKSTKEIREGNKNRYALSNSFLLDFFFTFCVKTKSKENKKMNNNLNVEVSDTTGDAIKYYS